MRAHSTWTLSFLIASIASAGLGACAAPQGDDAEGQTSNVTGGSSAVESPVLYLFDGASRADAPTCAGAMLGDKVAVTAKSCAKEGLIVGRASDKNGRGAWARVAKVHLPEDADADIAVIELDRALEGTNALITHMPLRAGYAINGIAKVDGDGLLAPEKGEASSVTGAMLEENATHGVIVPTKGSEICDGDLGAPVCSTTGTKIAGYQIRGTCGLSGLVVGRAAEGDAKSECSGAGWKVTSLGRYAAFLKEHAPTAFEPQRIDKPIIRNFPYVPEGLWGYQTDGEVSKCKIETASLSAVPKATATAKITAKVSFSGMGKRAAPWGRFGIAPKSDPTNMRWLPAKALSPAKDAAFETGFEGVVTAGEEGDYVVAFRASANGGETWTRCDTDGIANGFEEDKTLALRVGLSAAPSEETAPDAGSSGWPEGPGEGTGYSDPPADTSPSSSEGDEGYDDSYGNDDSYVGDEDELEPKNAEAGGCSMAATGTSNASSALSLAGALFALAAFTRRKKRS